MYFLWIDWYKKKQKFLFNDAIYAWPLGPVIPSVYYEYCGFMSNPINLMEKKNPTIIGMTELDSLIKKYYDLTAYELVKKSHKHNSAWSKVYQNGEGYKAEIPFNEIIKNDC